MIAQAGVATGLAHVDIRRVSKRFGGATALRDASLRIDRGAVHALVGENGAGKSTLGRVISGAIQPDAGTLSIDGEAVEFRSPRDALLAGVTTITQELTLMPARSVVDNVFVGMEPRGALGRVRASELSRRYEELADRAGIRVEPTTLVRDLPPAQRQKVEILRALARDARLIVMDEPTTSLTSSESSQLITTIRRLASSGTTIVFVTHFLAEVLEVADRVTVLKDGRCVRTTPARGETKDTLVEAMLGRKLARTPPAGRRRTGQALLEVRGLSTAAGLGHASLQVDAGEIVGVAGLVGSGRSELLRGIYGADAVTAGEVRVAGRVVTPRSPREAIRAGLALLPESRREQGLLMRRSVRENMALSQLSRLATAGLLRRRTEGPELRDLAGRLRIQPQAIDGRAVATLSGGNQQKVLLARCLTQRPSILLCDEPTRGVDVGAKESIYRLLRGLADDGLAVLFASSEPEELIDLSDRVLVMRDRHLAAELTGSDLTEDQLTRSAFGAPQVQRGEA